MEVLDEQVMSHERVLSELNLDGDFILHEINLILGPKSNETFLLDDFSLLIGFTPIDLPKGFWIISSPELIYSLFPSPAIETFLKLIVETSGCVFQLTLHPFFPGNLLPTSLSIDLFNHGPNFLP